MKKNDQNKKLAAFSKFQSDLNDLRAFIQDMGKKSELDKSAINYINKSLDNIDLISKLFTVTISPEISCPSLTNIEDILLHINKTHEEALKELVIEKINKI
ncbi:MAG: hypothetical protein LBT38_02460 [Deltaproteobacteria bacterium]|jgi:hypothetical protein|nr:hypothetical protein [Deltaproteobacteria bacterium]